MTAAPIVPVIPALTPTGRAIGGAPVPVRRPLPVAELPAVTRDEVDVRYALSALDHSGRVSDRSLVRALGWAAGTRLDVHERAGLIVVGASAEGVHCVSDTGFVTVPLTVRRWCRLRTGDRLLLAGYLSSAT